MINGRARFEGVGRLKENHLSTGRVDRKYSSIINSNTKVHGISPELIDVNSISSHVFFTIFKGMFTIPSHGWKQMHCFTRIDHMN